MDTIIVASKEFRQHFPKYQKLVEKGASLTVVKRSKPIFRIEPIDLEWQNKITNAVIDYHTDKKAHFVEYDDVFKAAA